MLNKFWIIRKQNSKKKAKKIEKAKKKVVKLNL